MLRQASYTATFRRWAERHKLIQHTDAAPRFARIIISADPLQRVADLHELTSKVLGVKLKPGPGQQVLVLEALQTSYRNNGGDNRTRVRSGAFYVLQQVDKNNRDTIDAALDATEETGEDILAAIIQELSAQVKIRLDESSITNDPATALGDGTWYGTRFDFDYTTPATPALTYSPAKFLP
jgi:hypothetical protein